MDHKKNNNARQHHPNAPAVDHLSSPKDEPLSKGIFIYLLGEFRIYIYIGWVSLEYIYIGIWLLEMCSTA